MGIKTNRWLLFIISFLAVSASADNLLVEAESFDSIGGWVNDQQFMDQMGSPFLLAHGLGSPVEDAVTQVNLPLSGVYRVWVRTRDWVAPWKRASTPDSKRATGTPGVFKVIVNGTPLDTVFGSENENWHWQDGGTIKLNSGTAMLALHDLTGFEGRCDAILFSSDVNYMPSDDAPPEWRRELKGLPDRPKSAGKYDLVVVGGGIAGTCAAIKAAQLGLKVALIHDRPVLGGNNSSEVRVWLCGSGRGSRVKKLGDVLEMLEQGKRAHYGPENQAGIYEDDKKIAAVKAQENIEFFPSFRMNSVSVFMDDGRISDVVAEHISTGERLSFDGKFFADCTGDGCLAYRACADWEMTLEEGHMGRCNLWHVSDTGAPTSFVRCPWALNLSDKPFPGRSGARQGGKGELAAVKSLGGWYWESGFYHDPFDQSEYIRDWNFRAMYGAWDCLKNVDQVFSTYNLSWCAYISGKRESRRILGDIVLNKSDVVNSVVYDDGLVPTGWKIDLHLPDPRYEKGFEGDAFISRADFTGYKTPYYIPYRCFYSRNVNNLLMAGRCVSVTHEALGTVRVMRTGGLMGEVVGMAASLCVNHDVDPRGVYKDHLAELKELCGYVDADNQPVILDAGSKRRVVGEDDQYVIRSLPVVLQNLPSVVIDRGSWKQPASGYKFAVNVPVKVYLAVHDRGGYIPPPDWKRTGMTLNWYSCSDSVYEKSFPPGIVEIPPHDGCDGSNYGIPHTAFVEGAGFKITTWRP